MQMMPPFLLTWKKHYNDSSPEFGLIISLKKTNIMGQDISTKLCISISDYTVGVVDNFTYLTTTNPNNLCLSAELNVQIGKAAAATMLTTNTKTVYQAYVLEDSSLWQRVMDILMAPTGRITSQGTTLSSQDCQACLQC